MDGRSFVCVMVAYFLAFLSHNKKEDGNKNSQTDLKQLEKNTRMHHLKDGLSPKSVLSAIGGSLSCQTLIIFVIFLQVQSCAAAFKGDEVKSSDWQYLRSYMTPKGGDENTSDPLFFKNSTASTGYKMNTSDWPPFESNATPTGNEKTSSDWHDFMTDTKLTDADSALDSASDSVDLSLHFPNEPALLPAEEGDEWDPTDLPHMKKDTTVKDDLLKFFCTPAGYVCIAALGALGFLLLYVCWRKCCTGAAKTRSEEDPAQTSTQIVIQGAKQSRSTQDPSLCSAEDETQALPNQSTKEEDQVTLSSLKGQRTDAESLRHDLKSQLQKVRQELEENESKRESVEDKLKNETADKKQELLSEKENLYNFKWKLNDLEADRNRLLQQAEKLLETIDTVTNKISGCSTV